MYLIIHVPDVPENLNVPDNPCARCARKFARGQRPLTQGSDTAG